LLAFIEADQASIADTGFAEYGLSNSLIDSKQIRTPEMFYSDKYKKIHICL
jgi:hypothetical protein